MDNIGPDAQLTSGNLVQMRMLLFAVSTFGLAILFTTMSGCGRSSDESKLDRVPNVPPSTRSQGDQAFPVDPK